MFDYNKFIKRDSEREEIFTKMVEQISVQTNTREDLIQEAGEKAFQNWEKLSKKSINTFYSMPKEERSYELNNIMRYFRIHLRTMFIQGDELNKSLDIASEAFKSMFKI